MNTSHNMRLVELLVFFILSGCSQQDPNEGARQLARETLAQTIEYEDSLRAFNRELNSYYSASFGDLEAATLAEQNISQGVLTNQMAGDLADRLTQRDFRDSDFRDFVLQYLATKKEATLRDAAALDHLKQEKQATLSQINLREQQLNLLRGKLEKLQEVPSMEDRISQLREYFDAAREAYKKASQQN